MSSNVTRILCICNTKICDIRLAPERLRNVEGFNEFKLERTEIRAVIVTLY